MSGREGHPPTNHRRESRPDRCSPCIPAALAALHEPADTTIGITNGTSRAELAGARPHRPRLLDRRARRNPRPARRRPANSLDPGADPFIAALHAAIELLTRCAAGTTGSPATGGTTTWTTPPGGLSLSAGSSASYWWPRWIALLAVTARHPADDDCPTFRLDDGRTITVCSGR